MIAEVLRGGSEVIDHLAHEWRALCEERPFDEPFYRPEWFGAYVRAFASGKELFVATARLQGCLVAVLPLIRELGSLDGIPARKLRAAGNAHTCRYDLIHRPHSAHAAIGAIWRVLLGTPGWDVLELSNVPHRAALTQLVRLAQSQGYATHAARSLTSPYLTLQAGEDRFDAVLARIDGKFHANLRRRRRKLEAKGPIRLSRTDVADELLARFYELERAGWKGKEGSAIACDARTRQFYDDLAREAERVGHLSLYALECNGRPVAMYYGLMHGGRYFLLKTAYDELFRDCSPGQLITHDVLRDLAVLDCVEFDFLGPLMDWKMEWAPRLRPHADWYVFRGPLGRLLRALRFHLRPAAGRLKRRWRARRETKQQSAVAPTQRKRPNDA